ncbi:hypothetical protein DM01DRAFT_1340757 [Hesseltinella vesiculosa]|uniref:Uncharacterized protein n=1 Tax=Hesseltinella vesiculosa TaxID=101127 RepID=A0A1X2G355_9FUNG|nr:hypothetical protein DM01DRAFT_1340757 [Hesseltinella vesiculosa]
MPLPLTPITQSARQTYDEGIIDACLSHDASQDEKKRNIWIVDALGLQPVSLIDNNNVEQTALVH